MNRPLCILLAFLLLTVEPASALQPGKPQTGTREGLTVFRVGVPKLQFVDAPSRYTPIGEWRVEVSRGNARQIYLGVDGRDESSVAVLGLAEREQALTLAFIPVSGQSLHKASFEIEVDLATAESVDPGPLLAQWSSARRWALMPYPAGEPAGGLLRPMLRRSAHLYERPGAADDLQLGSTRRRRGQTTNGFSLFSGEAAVQETLQQQLLVERGKPGGLDHSINELSGPQIRSHPFAEMLGDNVVDTPAIASLVPIDRYFLQIDDVGAALAWLDQTAKTGLDLIGLKLGARVGHDLVDRYLARLRFSRPLVEKLARAGVIGDLALFGPDLYLHHGSELTVILDAEHSLAVNLVFAPLLGNALGSERGDVTAYGPGNEPPAYFARHERWLIFSTNEEEASAALKLARNDGAGSLGRSAEFQYMYALLPPKHEVDGPFVYFSDPFIRSMVGPATKIGQLRRHQARARLTLVAAGQALHDVERGESADLETLVSRGYVEQAWLDAPAGDVIDIDARGMARSSLHGRLDQMAPLSRLAVERITESEKKGYEDYVSRYSRYWRRFFDPIGIRVSVADPLEIETVILPLIENSIYTGVRELVGGEPVDLRRPDYLPRPVTTLSMKMPPVEAFEPFSGLEYLGPIDEIFGEGVHIALYDSSPLVGLGSTDLIGGFSGEWLRGGGSWLLWGGLAASMLTQPTTIFVELDADFARSGKAEALLHGLAFRWLRGDSDGYRLDRVGEREWVFTWSLEGLIRFHGYLSVVDDYLVISNRRQALVAAPGEPEEVKANAAIRVQFDEVRELAALLGLHRLQHEQASAFRSVERLRPFFVMGAESVEQAIDEHELLFGTRPMAPAGSRWRWNASTKRLENDRFGDPFDSRLPVDWLGEPGGGDDGLFGSLENLNIEFKFEEAGVRTTVRIE